MAAVTVAAPAIITAGENTAVWVQVSSKVAVGAGLLEGYIKSKFEKSPPRLSGYVVRRAKVGARCLDFNPQFAV